MIAKKKLGKILLVAGTGIFIFGSYIAHEAGKSKQQLAQADADVDSRRKPIIGPVRKNIRAQSAASAKEKISQGMQRVIHSQVTANWMRGTGVVLFVVGLGCFFFKFANKKRD